MHNVLLRLGLLLVAGVLCLHPAPGYSSAATTTTGTLQLEPLPTTGTLTAAQIGNGVWWRPTLNETSVTQVMADMQRWGYRNLFLETLWNGRTIYPSDHFDSWKDDGRDWLQHIVNEGKKHDVRVIAWIHTLYWSHTTDTLAMPRVVREHPEWLEVTRDGESAVAPGGGHLALFVSPAVPKVREKLLSAVDEILTRGVAGINLDYIRYNADADFGYHPLALEGFREQTGLDAMELEPDTDDDSDWMKWVRYREDLVTSVVKVVSERVREFGDEVGERKLVTSAYFPGYAATRGKNQKYQNWLTWLARGYLDVSTPMCYAPTLTGLEKELREVRSAHQGAPVACIPALAVGKFFSPHPSLAEQKRVLNSAGFRYYSIFKYETLKQELESKESSALAEDVDESRETIEP